MLDIREDTQVDIQHIAGRPDSLTTRSTVSIIMSLWSLVQRYFIFIVVVLVVGTEAQEYAHFLVGKHILFAFEGIGMCEHLEMLITTKVDVHSLVNRPRITACQTIHCYGKSLFVLLCELWLSRVNYTGDTRRHDVVDRGLTVVLFDIDRSNTHRSSIAWLIACVKCLLVWSPLTANKVETGKSQHYRTLEVGHVHSHESDARHVADTSDSGISLLHRDAEQIPSTLGILGASVSEVSSVIALIHDILRTDIQISRIDFHMIAVVLLVLIHRVVHIHILAIGRRLIGCGVRLTRSARIRRVALKHIDALVTIQNRSAGIVIITATEIMVVVAGRVVPYSIESRLRHLGAHGVQIIGIGREGAFVSIIQTVQTYILLGAGSTFV